MPIKNSMVRIPRAGVIRLGSEKGPKAPGRNLSYFRVDTPYFTDEQLEEYLGSEPKALKIKFPRIDRENEEKSLDFIFDASYKAYKNGSLFCKGDGETAIRAIAKGKLEPVPCTCKFLTGENPICKQRGELKVILSDLPFMGYFQIGTSSWNSINSIQGVIDMYYELLGPAHFWMAEFAVFKEEVTIQNRRQYIMKLKIANSFISHLPKGGELIPHAVMMFEDDGSGGHHEAAGTEPLVETEPTEAPCVEPDDTAPELPAIPEDMEPPTPDTAPVVDPVSHLPKDAPAPQPQDKPDEKPAPRDITPQRRSREIHVKKACEEFMKLTHLPSVESVVDFFKKGQTIQTLSDADLNDVFNQVREGIKQGIEEVAAEIKKEKVKPEDTMSVYIGDSDIPF